MGIMQIAAGSSHTVGLRTDGTVVATGLDYDGSCSGVVSWTDIIQVAAGCDHTVGLRSNGTVVAVGNDGWRQCHVGDWMLF
jgi:alpha-tubulin suppressor-like RCC1 family protein